MFSFGVVDRDDFPSSFRASSVRCSRIVTKVGLYWIFFGDLVCVENVLACTWGSDPGASSVLLLVQKARSYCDGA